MASAALAERLRNQRLARTAILFKTTDDADSSSSELRNSEDGEGMIPRFGGAVPD